MPGGALAPTMASFELPRPAPGTAIVAEGGGQRGIFTAGVLDAFLDAGFNPFSSGVGASAGAQNLLTYFLGIPGYAKRAIAELTSVPGFFVPYRWLGKRSVVDLDMYFRRVLQDPLYELPFHRLDAVRTQRKLIFVATRRDALAPVYLEPDALTVLDFMKASSAVPFLYREGVTIGDDVLFDGGVADPIPVQHAWASGARRLLVIRTTPHDLRVSSWRQRLEMLRLYRLLPPDALAMLERHEAACREALRFLEDPPAGLELFEIAPDVPLKSYVFGSRSAALLHDYEAGRQAGADALAVLQRWAAAPAGQSATLAYCAS